MDAQLDKALRISATLARSRYAGEDKRIDRGLVMALNDKVQIQGGLCRVQSDRDPEVFYVISAHGCDCHDSTSTAPEHRCKHVWAGKLLAHAFQNKPENIDYESQVLENPDDKCSMSDDAQEKQQKESSMSDVVLYTTAPKSFDKDTTVEVCDKFLYAMSCTSTTMNMATTEYKRQDTMRKVSIPSKKALTQERAYNKPGIYFTCSETKATELREKGTITMTTHEGTPEVGAEHVETPEPEPVETAPKRKRTRKVTTTSTREDGTIVHVTVPENEPIVPTGEPERDRMVGCGEGTSPTPTLDTLVEELTGKPYAGPLPGTFTVVEVAKGTCALPAPEGSKQTAHLSCNKQAQDPEVIPVVPAIVRLRGVLRHALSYDVYDNMVEAITTGLEAMGVRLGATAPAAPSAPRAPRAPRAPQEPKAPKTEGTRVGGLTDAQVTHARTAFAKGAVTVGALAKDMGVPKSTLRRCLRLGGLIKQRD